MLYYQNQPSRVVFDGVTLTSTYAGNRKVIETAGFSKIALYLSYTLGAAETGNTLELQLDASHDGTTWYPLVIDDTATQSEIIAREWTMGGGNLNILVDIAYPYMRASLKESDVASNAGTASVHYTLSGL